MIKNLLIIFFLSIGLVQNISAQVELVLENGENVMSYTFDTNPEGSQKIGYSLQNNTDLDLGWFWQVELSEDFPAEWEVQVCDQQKCYNYNELQANVENILGSGDKTQFAATYVHVLNNGVSGTAELKFVVYDSDDYDNVIVSTDFTSSVKDAYLEDITIYPNPTTDFIRFTDDEAIAQVSIHNIVGKEVMSMSHTSGKRYDVSNLKSGMYLVRLLDNNSKVLKSLRLSKR